MFNSFFQEHREVLQTVALITEGVTGYPIGKVANIGYALLDGDSSDLTGSILRSPALKELAIGAIEDGLTQLASSGGADIDDYQLKSVINFISYKIFDIGQYVLTDNAVKDERISQSNTYNEKINSVSEGTVMQSGYGDHIMFPQAVSLASISNWANYNPNIPTVNPPTPKDGDGTEERVRIMYSLGLGDYNVTDVVIGNTTLNTDENDQNGFYRIYNTSDIFGASSEIIDVSRRYIVPTIDNVRLLPATRVESTLLAGETNYNNYFIRGANTDNRIIRTLPISNDIEFYPTPSGEQIDSYRFNLTFPEGRALPMNNEGIGNSWLVVDIFGVALEQRIEDLDGNIIPQRRLGNDGNPITGSEGTQWNIIQGERAPSNLIGDTIPMTMQDQKLMATIPDQSGLSVWGTNNEIRITVEGRIRYGNTIATLQTGQRFKFRIRAFHLIRTSPQRIDLTSNFTNNSIGRYIGDTNYARLNKLCLLKSFEVVLSESSIQDNAGRNRTGATLFLIQCPPTYQRQLDFSAPEFVRRNRFSVRGTRILPVYDGTQWIMQPTRSPVWAIVDILTNQTYGGRLNRDVNLFPAELRTLALELEAEQVYYDEVIDQPASPLAIVTNIADLFSLIVYEHGHVFRIRRDRYSTQIDFLLTEVDLMSDSNLLIEFPNEERTRSIIATFTARTTWQRETTRVGELVTSPRTITVTGITQRSKVQEYVQRKMLRSQYRNTKFTLRIAYVGMLLFPTQIVGVAHPLFGQNNSTGEVVTFTNITNDMGVVTGADFTLNNDVSGDGFILFRLRDGERSNVYPVTRVDRNTIRITGDVIPLENNVITNLSRRRTQYTFAQNEADLYTICKVLSIKPISDVSTDVELLVEDPRAYV